MIVWDPWQRLREKRSVADVGEENDGGGAKGDKGKKVHDGRFPRSKIEKTFTSYIAGKQFLYMLVYMTPNER